MDQQPEEEAEADEEAEVESGFKKLEGNKKKKTK